MIEIINAQLLNEYSDNYLTVVVFYRDGPCPCKRLLQQFDLVEKYLTEDDLSVRLYKMNVDEISNIESVDRYDAVFPPKTVYIYKGQVRQTVDGYQHKGRIIDTIYGVLTGIKNDYGVIL